MSAAIDDYIDASIKYMHIEEKIVSNKRIPSFSYKTFLDDKNDIINDYRFRLKDWIINKKSSNEKFIPLIDRIDLNEQKTIAEQVKLFDQTKENTQSVFQISNITIKKNKGD